MSALRINPEAVAADLEAMHVDGWLITDFRGSNPVAAGALDLGASMLTRRWALWLPRSGKPELIINGIEVQSLPKIDVPISTYKGFSQWRDHLRRLVADKQIAVEWYPDGAIPYLSRIDGGLADLLRGMGCKLTSSAHLSQRHLVLWGPARMASHRRAAVALTEIVTATLDRVRASSPGSIDEATVQSWILEAFDSRGMVTDHAPIVGVDGHAGDPHYVPPAVGSSVLGERFVLLVDLWAGFKGPDCAFADITWMARRGPVSAEIEHGFRTVLKARDAGVALMQRAWADGRRAVAGFEVDDAVRAVIEQAGLGEAFIHRTGHSLGIASAHGDGANIDGFEAQDTRPVETGLAVTIEPGVYYSTWGIRSEINVAMDPGPVVTTDPQTDWVEV